MKHELNFWVVGGDMRQAKLAQLLAEDGHTVHTYALGQPQEPLPGLAVEDTLRHVERADCVILPLTVADGNGQLNAPLAVAEYPLGPVFDRLSPKQFLCGGRISPDVQALASERGLTIHDYFAREELAVANAVPTALAIGHIEICFCITSRLVCTKVGFAPPADTVREPLATQGIPSKTGLLNQSPMAGRRYVRPYPRTFPACGIASDSVQSAPGSG